MTETETRDRQDTLIPSEGDSSVEKRAESEREGERGDTNSAINREKEGEDKKEEEDEGEEKEAVNARHMSVAFRQELLSTVHLKIDSRIGLEISRLSDSGCELVQLMARCLPHIVPNVILAKREVCVCVCACVQV